VKKAIGGYIKGRREYIGKTNEGIEKIENNK